MKDITYSLGQFYKGSAPINLEQAFEEGIKHYMITSQPYYITDYYNGCDTFYIFDLTHRIQIPISMKDNIVFVPEYFEESKGGWHRKFTDVQNIVEKIFPDSDFFYMS